MAKKEAKSAPEPVPAPKGFITVPTGENASATVAVSQISSYGAEGDGTNIVQVSGHATLTTLTPDEVSAAITDALK